jgi:hypothetical protein
MKLVDIAVVLEADADALPDLILTRTGELVSTGIALLLTAPPRRSRKRDQRADAQARDRIGRWTTGGSVALARQKFHQAREAHKASPTPVTLAARTAAFSHVKQRRGFAAKVQGKDTYGLSEAKAPHMNAEQRAAHIAPHRAALHEARAVHEALGLPETAARLATAQQGLKEARRQAGSQRDRGKHERDLHEANQEMHSARKTYERELRGEHVEVNAEHELQVAEGRVLEVHAASGTPTSYTEAATEHHAYGTSEANLGTLYQTRVRQELASSEGEPRLSDHRAALKEARSRIVEEARTHRDKLEWHMTDAESAPRGLMPRKAVLAYVAARHAVALVTVDRIHAAATATLPAAKPRAKRAPRAPTRP